MKTNPDHPQALYELGDLYASSGDVAGAEKYLLEALKLDPSMVEPRFALEKMYTEGAKYDKSIAQLRAVLREHPDQSTAHYRLAQVYRKVGRQEDAQREIALFDPSRARPGAAQRALRERNNDSFGQTVQNLVAAARPSNAEMVYFSAGPQPEVHARVVDREITAAVANDLQLRISAGFDADFCADRVPIRPMAAQIETDPMGRRFSSILEENGRPG